MGRRAVKPVDPKLDLSGYLKSPDDLPQPWDQHRLYATEQPLEIEVGSGKGLFMQNASGEFPERNFLGIEIAGRYARLAAAKLAKRSRTNAVMVSGDAIAVLQEKLPTASAVAVHVYFPDPWWKKRHRKRRVMCEPFVEQVIRVLQHDGRLHFWTDVAEYFETALDLLDGYAALHGPLEVPERPAEHHLDYRTHFERRTRLQGEAVYRAEFRKDS